ncbi:MAG: hypothetical protein LBQ55_00410 [Treponema sp.]|jgi:hypothetical protein|nr:hypothetical protein [Treponema sp.]
MGRIKSALEIAMERTESVKSDKSSITEFEARQRGKKLANDFLEDPAIDMAEEINKAPKEEQAALKQGVFDVLRSQIILPLAKDDLKRIEKVGKGLQTVIGAGRFAGVFKQLIQGLTQYLDEADRYEEAIRRQYAPKLRQKEEELSRRMGREVRIDPFQDPEFIAFFNQNMNALKGSYQAMVDQVRDEAARLFEGA